jgi:hypothetical protein
MTVRGRRPSALQTGRMGSSCVIHTDYWCQQIGVEGHALLLGMNGHL